LRDRHTGTRWQCHNGTACGNPLLAHAAISVYRAAGNRASQFYPQTHSVVAAFRCPQAHASRPAGVRLTSIFGALDPVLVPNNPTSTEPLPVAERMRACRIPSGSTYGARRGSAYESSMSGSSSRAQGGNQLSRMSTMITRAVRMLPAPSGKARSSPNPIRSVADQKLHIGCLAILGR